MRVAWRGRKATGLVGLVAGALCAAGAAGPGAAVAGERADFALALANRAPASPSALSLQVRFKAAGNPDGKPSPIRRAVVAAPAGTRFVLDAVPACAATDEQLRALGEQACPARSRIGSGTLTAITGFGPAVDPASADLVLFNTPGGFVELAVDRRSRRTLGFDRARIEGHTATLAPPMTPGGPPDGETAVRDIDFTIDAPGYVRTPPGCPADGVWRSAGSFGFADGAQVTEHAVTPCAGSGSGSAPVAGHARPAPARARPRLVVRPRRVRAGRRVVVRAHVRGVPWRCARGVRMRLGRRSRRAGADGRALLGVRLSRGRHVVVVRRKGCPAVRGAVVAA